MGIIGCFVFHFLSMNEMFDPLSNKQMIAIQGADWSIKRSMFYSGMPNYNYKVNTGWTRTDAQQTWRSYPFRVFIYLLLLLLTFVYVQLPTPNSYLLVYVQASSKLSYSHQV